MKILIDTSALLRFLVADDRNHERVLDRVEELAQDGHSLVLTPQVSRECWVVLTRPKSSNGFGLRAEYAGRLFGFAEAVFALIDDVPGIYETWKKLVHDHTVSGKQVHDANHVAAMLAHGIEAVLTLDKRDFERYPDIQVLTI